MDAEDLRLAVYESFARRGTAPSVEELAQNVESSVEAVRAGLDALHKQRHVVLDGDRIVMAHPFSATNLGFSVMGDALLWWGGCAWDSFALPHLLPDQSSVLVATTCPGCGAALAWCVDREAPPVGLEVAHFLIPVARMWDDVVRTCGHQRLFCSDVCVELWLNVTRHERGYVLDLAQLWRLAAGWYAGRLERGYVRRDPAAAKEYFRKVGLAGEFWGL